MNDWPRRAFGDTEFIVPALGFGAGHMGDPAMSEADVEALLKPRPLPAESFESFAIPRAHQDARVNIETRSFRDPRDLARSTQASWRPR